MQKPFYTSSTDIETAAPFADGCYRKLYFKKVEKLPVPQTSSTIFGDVIHAVAERFLLADDNGNDKNGLPVDLYPEDWERPKNRYTGEPSKDAVGIEEQAIIKALISKAIEEGILMRVKGRKVERKIDQFKIMEGVFLNGFIDLLEPGAIRDHKSTKSMNYAKSTKRTAKESLYGNIQLMCYAFWYYTDGGYDKSKPCALSHQYYVKDAEKTHVEKREVSVTWPEVEAFHREKLTPVLEKMKAYRDAKSYADVPLPDDVASACRKFGGCPFTRICTEQETITEYKKRVEAQLAGTSNTNYNEVANGLKKGEETMSESPMMAKIRAMKAGQNAPAVEGKTTPVAVEAVPVTVETKTEAVQHGLPKQKAPWYYEGCKSCSENPILGMNSKGTLPCKICDMFTGKAAGMTSDKYSWTVGNGVLVVSGYAGEAVMETTVTEKVTAKEVTAPKEQEVKPEPEVKKAEPKPEPVPELKPALIEENPVVEEAEKVFEGLDIITERDKFRIYLECATIQSKIKGGGKLGSPSCRITAEELLVLVNMEMAKILGVVRWEKMNAFEKRDAVSVFSKQIADLLGASTLTISRMPKSSLIEAIYLGISPYAAEIVCKTEM